MNTSRAVSLAVLSLWLLGDPAAAQQKQQPPQQQPAYVGKWAVRPDLCQTPLGASPDAPPPLILTSKRLVTGTMTCEFSSVKPNGPSYRVEANCTAGKERGRETFALVKNGDGLQWSWGDRSFNFVPCPG